jgi:transcriptional regulator with XRE-family HTH domain
MLYSNDMSDVFKSMMAGIADAGMSQSELARQSGISRQTLYRIREGEAPKPSFDTYVRLDRVYRAVVPAPRIVGGKTRL